VPAAAGGRRGVSSASAVFDHALGDDLVDRRLGEGSGDGLAGAVAFAVVGDPAGVGAQVSLELAYYLQQPVLLAAGFRGVEVDGDVFDGVQGPDDVAVPADHFSRSSCVATSPAGSESGTNWVGGGSGSPMARGWPCLVCRVGVDPSQTSTTTPGACPVRVLS